MAVTEAPGKIVRFERAVARRHQWLALLDALALALIVGGPLVAAAVLYIRLRPADAPVWAAVLIIFGAVAAGLLVRWYVTRMTRREAAFLIDEALGLEDRVATAHAVAERGGAGRAVEQALVEDAAGRIVGARASAVAPYVFKRWHPVGLAGLALLVAALAVPERSLPGGEALAEAREDIRAAGEQLEQTSTLIQQNVPPATDTARLAREQADLGRALRVSKETRAEALKKLGALEERLRQHQERLADTRADEIVNAAERRMQAALAPPAKPQPAKPAAQPDKPDAQIAQIEGDKLPADAEAKQTPPADRPPAGTESDKPEARQGDKPDQAGKGQPRDNAAGKGDGQQSQQVAGDAQNTRQQAGGGGQPQPPDGNKNQPSQPADAAGNDAGDNRQQQPDAGDTPPPDDLPAGALPEGALKATPMSEQLLKQAQKLRVGQFTPEQLERLRQAAQLLQKDLERLAQSREFREALERMARDIKPEEIEQVARLLRDNEQLRAELEATGRLLMQNREAREMASGLARQMQNRPDIGGRQGGSQSGGNQPGGNELRAGNSSAAAGGGQPGGQGWGVGRGLRGQAESDKLTGRGRVVAPGGQLQRSPGGKYLYIQSTPGAGAARAPYSSAYPQYRREAERSVERSQVPPHLRSVVRDYFDAINPDARRQN